MFSFRMLRVAFLSLMACLMFAGVAAAQCANGQCGLRPRYQAPPRPAVRWVYPARSTRWNGPRVYFRYRSCGPECGR